MRPSFLLPLLPLAACVPAAEPPPARVAPPPPAPVVAPVSAPAPVYRGDWRDWPLTAGDWVYRRDARGSIALFGPAGADAAVTLRCDRLAARLYLSRQGSGAAAMTVRTTSTTRTLTSQPTGGTPAYMAVALAPGDPLLDAMGFSRGRFVMEQQGLPVLVVPAWAEILRVVEDCRS